MIADRIVFRHLRGLDELMALEAVIHRHPNPLWAPEVDHRQPLVDRLSKAWFGITESDTQFEDTEDLDEEAWDAAMYHWEAYFDFDEITFVDAETDDQNELMIWDMLGWDCRDADGELHPLVCHFKRQMVCAAKGLRGRLPNADPGEEEITKAAEEWAKALMRKR